ncbi:translation elongation factor Ts [Buchnera aphidicola]|nr:translation elongation factor Ts [Buchnera aphidicola]
MRITSDLVKKLRLKSGIGIMECKKALITAKGDMQKAIIILKKNGQIKSENRSKNVALRGIIFTYLKKNRYAYILELNCETDFVAQHSDFIKFATEVLSTAYIENITDISVLKNNFESKRNFLISRFGENILIRRFSVLIGNTVTAYVHRNKIGVLLYYHGNNQDIIKKVAMHIAAVNPGYLSKKDIPKSILEEEKKIQLEIAIRTGKPVSIAKKIVTGRIEKFINNICLLGQDCVFDVGKKIQDVLYENNLQVIQFIRFELGEII